jgi:hypothetical protein
MNPKVIALALLLCSVSAATFWATRTYGESHSMTVDTVRSIGS